jgi:hypothetical protein
LAQIEELNVFRALDAISNAANDESLSLSAE